MQPEQQQRIMGYFIEEAKDHLNTIEQGVLNLQSTIEDQEMVNELFRAAHSVKGGAAMLGLSSIQQVSHRLEDYFKILKESPVKVDQKLEGLFLQVFDALQELVGQLQGPFGLTDETAKATVAGVEPVFDALETHLNVLASSAAPATASSRPIAVSSHSTASSAQQDSAFILLFQNDIPLRLREMLQLFKQSELDDANRQQLQDLCRHLISIGEQFDLPDWCALIEMSRVAIAHPDNAYRTLAPVVIRDIKQAQELVLSGRASEIVPCAQLQALQPPAPLVEPAIDDFADLLATADDADWLTEPSTATADDALFAGLDDAAPAIDFGDSFDLNDSFDTAPAEADHADQNGPEVGMAELNSLADLFEGEMPDLGSTWQEEEVLALPADVLVVSAGDTSDTDTAADFSDLLFDESEIGQEAASTSSQDALTDLFSDDLLQPDALPSELIDDRALPNSSDAQADLDALFTGLDSTDLSVSALTDTPTDQASSLFDTSSEAQADLDDLLAGSSAEDWSGLDVIDVPADQTNTAFDNIFSDLTPDGSEISLPDTVESDLAGFAFDDAPESDAPLDVLSGFFTGMDAAPDPTFLEFQTNSELQPVELNLDDVDDPFTMELDEQMFELPPVPNLLETTIIDPWGESESTVADPALSFVEQPALPLAGDESAPLPTNQDDFGDQWRDNDLSLEPIEALSEQNDLDFSSLLNSTADQAFTDSQLDLAEDLALEELTDDGLDPSIASWLTDDTLPVDETLPETLSADADLESLDWSFPSGESLPQQANTAFQTDFSDPWAVPSSQEATTTSTSDAFDLDASAVDDATVEPPMAEMATDAGSLAFDVFDFNEPNFGSAANPPEPVDLEAGLDIDFGSFSTDNALDANLLDASDSWLVSEDSEQPTDPAEALGDPFAETPDTISADLFNESLLDRSLDQSDVNAFAFDTSSESLSDSLDDLSVAQPLELTDDLGDLFDQPNQSDESFDLPDDLLAIGVSPESQPREPADALSDELLGLTDLNSLDDLDDLNSLDDLDDLNGLEPSAPLDENLALNDGLFELDEPVLTNGVGQPESDYDAMAFDLFASTDTDATSTEFDAIAAAGEDAADTPAVTASEASFDNENLDFDLFESDVLNDSVPSQDSAAEASLSFGDDFASNAPEDVDINVVPDLSAAESLDFGDALSLDFSDRSDTNGLTTDRAENEDFALNFESADSDPLEFDALPAESAAATDPLFEAAPPEAADLETTAFDFDWDSVNDDNITGDSFNEFDRPMDESGTPASTNGLEEFDDLLGNASQPDAVGELPAFDNLLSDETDAFDDLNSLLASGNAVDDEFSGLEAFLDQDSPTDALTELDAFLADESGSDFSAGLPTLGNTAGAVRSASPMGDFAELESLLQDESFELSNTGAQGSDITAARASEFDELDDLLKDAEEKMGGSPTLKLARSGAVAQNRRPTRPGRVFSEQTMRVPVKHLDNLSNLVGELVVNRNSLEEDQERLRQSLDNLLYQVQQLSDVGQRMQDLYERSLLESSLLASRQSHRSGFGASTSARESGVFAQTANATGIEYDPLEMDRFTGFHSLSQEMIELIVRVRESSSDIEFIVDETDQVTRMFRQVTTQLQEGLTRSRMVPFAQTADRLPRAVRDIAMKVGKQAELNVEGRETLIDKMILEQLYDPMTHLVNNAITHGIEPPEVRRAAGKPPSGRITIRAFHQGNQTIISVSDDGAGIDIDRVKAKAIEKGLITATEARNMARLDVYDLLFHAGFSTKDQADDFSGRGVGMDVVRTSLSEIRGAITTDSTYGKGTTFTIRLPLTLSISKALCCISDRARIAFPMDGVEDMLDVPKERIQTNAEGQACIPWRDSLLPLRPLSELLSYSRHLSRGNVYGGNQEDDIVSIVVLRSAGNFLALQVDQVLGEQEIVIKQLEGPIPKPVGVAGATVLGDGRIMPIADVLELIDLSLGRIRKDVGGSLWEQDGVSMIQEAPIAKTEPTVLIVDDSITVRELLSMTFNKVGYRVEQARDGQEAWEKLRAGLPCDIVFCDIEMPRMDGLELLSRIQKDPNLTHLPIAMLTSRGADRHRQMAVSLGASGYFTKPYLEEALLDAAQRMLKGEVLISNNA